VAERRDLVRELLSQKGSIGRREAAALFEVQEPQAGAILRRLKADRVIQPVAATMDQRHVPILHVGSSVVVPLRRTAASTVRRVTDLAESLRPAARPTR
jgi:hypothetical protein